MTAPAGHTKKTPEPSRARGFQTHTQNSCGLARGRNALACEQLVAQPLWRRWNAGVSQSVSMFAGNVMRSRTGKDICDSRVPEPVLICGACGRRVEYAGTAGSTRTGTWTCERELGASDSRVSGRTTVARRAT